DDLVVIGLEPDADLLSRHGCLSSSLFALLEIRSDRNTGQVPRPTDPRGRACRDPAQGTARRHASSRGVLLAGPTRAPRGRACMTEFDAEGVGPCRLWAHSPDVAHHRAT